MCPVYQGRNDIFLKKEKQARGQEGLVLAPGGRAPVLPADSASLSGLHLRLSRTTTGRERSLPLTQAGAFQGADRGQVLC